MATRKRYSQAEQKKVIGQYRESGQTLSEFCGGRGLETGRMKRWLTRSERKSPEGTRFVEVEQSKNPSAMKGLAKYRLGFSNGSWLEIEGGFEAAAIRELAGILRDGAC